ncbi:MAG TPA: malectin domain-containing carbohydrate-binding protein, partial [bacterium]|nr:malectin domain-containing carbohydrate-binding protein [bacterium]
MKIKFENQIGYAALKSFLVILFFVFSISAGQARPPYEVVGYALETTMAPTNTVTDNGQGANINWTTDIPWQDLTVVGDAFAIPATNDTFDLSEAKVAALITPAHANNVRCMLSIGGGGQDTAFSTLCLPANRAAFASAVTAVMMKYGYDGVDIDWESNTNQQADATAMMEDIYTKVKALPNSTVDGKPRTLSFTTVNYIDQLYNMTTLANYTDWCFFMGYDWGACPSLATGPLNSIATEIEALTDGSTWNYPISKMIFGCPFYTDYYTNNCNDTTDWDTLSVLHLGTPGAYNTTYAEQEYTVNGDTVYVDTAQSFCDKTNWALSHGLQGIGMWDMGNALPYTDSAVTQIWNTIGGNSACLNLGPTATPTKTATPVVASTWRVNAGGPAYTDSQSNVWAADENFTGGTAAVTTSTIAGSLPGAADQTLYQSQRYGSPFTYTFNVPAGSYQVTLKFAETYWTAAGKRVFNVLVNGATVLTNFDIYAAAGAQNKAIDEVFNNIAPTGGVITIQFGPASADNAEVDAIQIVPQPTTATPTPTFSKTATMTLTSSPTVANTSTFT